MSPPASPRSSPPTALRRPSDSPAEIQTLAGPQHLPRRGARSREQPWRSARTSASASASARAQSSNRYRRPPELEKSRDAVGPGWGGEELRRIVALQGLPTPFCRKHLSKHKLVDGDCVIFQLIERTKLKVPHLSDDMIKLNLKWWW